MADDITLTVRVRDLTRGEFNRIGGHLRRMQQNMQGVNRTTATGGRNARMFSQDLNRLSTQLLHVARSGSISRREITAMTRDMDVMGRTLRRSLFRREISFASFRSARRDLIGLQRQLRITAGEGNPIRRLGDRFIVLGHQIRRSGDGATFLRRRLTGIGGGMVSGMGRAVAATGLMLGAMLALGRAINMNKRWTAMLIATLLLLGPAAAALGGILVAVLGAAFLALGAFALRGNQQVKTAFTEMKSTVGTVVRESASVLQGPLVSAMGQVGQAALDMQPMLTQAFGALAPLVEDMVGAFTDLLGQALPGFTAALQNSEAATAAFRTAMGLVGQGLGDMFKIMTEGNEDELRRIWEVLGTELNNLLINIGQFVSVALNSETAVTLLIGVFRSFGGALNLVSGLLQAVDSVFGGLFETIITGVSGVDKLASGMDGITNGFVNTAKPLKELQNDLVKVNDEIAKAEAFEKKMSAVKGPARDHVRKDAGIGDLQSLLLVQAQLTSAIAAAEREAATAMFGSNAAIRDQINALRELNSLNQGSLDARRAMEAAIDDGMAKAKEFAGALKYEGDQLNLNSEAARGAYEGMAKIASTSRETIQALIEQQAPWSQIQAAWQRGQGSMMQLGAAMKMSAGDARMLTNSILGVPDLKVMMQANVSDLETKIAQARSSLNSLPKEKHAAVLAHIEQLERQLAAARAALNALDGHTVNTYITTNRTERVFTERMKYKADADGSIHNMQQFANGGESHHAQISRGTLRLWGEPETQGEAYIPLADTKRTRSMNILQDVAQKFGYRLEKFAGGGVSEILGSMNISSSWKQAGTKLSPFRKSLATPGGVSELIRALNDWKDKIRKATSGNVEKRLMNAMAKTGAFLIKHQIALTKVTAAIDKAKDKLNDLKDKAAQLNEQVTSGIVSSGNITGAAESGRPTVVSDIMDRLISQKGKAVEFAKMLKILQQRGLGGQAISEIAQAGIDGGGFETASALLKASPKDIQQINAAQKEIAKAAAAAGKTASDAMYAGAIKAAAAMVKALQKQASKIAASMMNAVVALEKAIRRALGKKATGGVVGAAGGGPRSRMTLVGEHGPEIVDLAAGSMVRSNPDTRRLLANSFSGGGGVIQANIILDGRVAARALIDPLRGEIRDKGGNVQNVLGQRGK